VNNYKYNKKFLNKIVEKIKKYDNNEGNNDTPKYYQFQTSVN